MQSKKKSTLYEGWSVADGDYIAPVLTPEPQGKLKIKGTVSFFILLLIFILALWLLK